MEAASLRTEAVSLLKAVGSPRMEASALMEAASQQMGVESQPTVGESRRKVPLRPAESLQTVPVLALPEAASRLMVPEQEPLAAESLPMAPEQEMAAAFQQTVLVQGLPAAASRQMVPERGLPGAESPPMVPEPPELLPVFSRALHQPQAASGGCRSSCAGRRLH
jgi:hypothetical protein